MNEPPGPVDESLRWTFRLPAGCPATTCVCTVSALLGCGSPTGNAMVTVTAPVAKLLVRQLSSARSVVRTEQTRTW